MYLRKRIARTLSPALEKRNQSVKMIMFAVEENLLDVVYQFVDGYGFLRKLQGFLESMGKKLERT
jgi:hypothetical protein